MHNILDTLSDVSSSSDEEDDKDGSILGTLHQATPIIDPDHDHGDDNDDDDDDKDPVDSCSPIPQIDSNQMTTKTRKRKRTKRKPVGNIETLRYWSKRYDLFERFDLGVQLDDESWYSVTPEIVARQQAKMCACDFVIDLFAGVGGNTIQFAQTCGLVLAIDNSFPRLLMLNHNSQIYGTIKNTMVICGDASLILRALIRDRSTDPQLQSDPPTLSPHPNDNMATTTSAATTTIGTELSNLTSPPDSSSIRLVDCIFMSPPWGGPGYTGVVFPPGSGSWNARKRRQWMAEAYPDAEPTKNIQEMQLLYDALAEARHLSDRILIYLPRNSSVGQLLQLGWPQSPCQNPHCTCQSCLNVTIEDYCLRGRRLAVGAYLGYFPSIVGRLVVAD